MNGENNNAYASTFQNLNIKNFSEPQIPSSEITDKNIPHDEPGLYHALGTLSFATATLLLGIYILDGYHNGKLLTIFGFFIGGLGQLIAGILCYKYKYYIDGTTYFFFTFNWSISACYDLFPIFGLMEPLNGRELGFHNLMGCLFTFVFFLQNLGSPDYLTRISFTTTFIGFVFSTIGNFTSKTGLIKTAGVFNIITAVIAYYCAFAMTINVRYKKVWIPVLDGKKCGQKLD